VLAEEDLLMARTAAALEYKYRQHAVRLADEYHELERHKDKVRSC
jgi:hypothetical protein